MDGLTRLSDIIDTLLKDISKYENADGTKNAIKYFYNEKEKVITDLKIELMAINYTIEYKLNRKDKLIQNYIEYFVDKEMEKND